MPNTKPNSTFDRIRDYLKQIVYGGNDGIVTTFAIVAGFAGARAEGIAQIGGLAVVVFGLANLFADAVSMGLGEFLSARSQHQMYRRRRAERLEQIHQDRNKATDSLADQFGKRGLQPSQARQAAEAISNHAPMMADMLLSHEKAGMAPERDNPAINGLVTFGAFVVFGLLPILPYLIRDADQTSFQLSLSTTLLALTLLGVLRGWATQENYRRAVTETLGVGSVCAAVAFFVGWLVGG
ncbi:VIT family protein [Thalassovita gelatinovora]|uniref:VIT family protein n=1 Tax=Thalassovita gelatinovora TaxID=53501 RepID=A0A0P1F545_THAGE|nr:VIT1/CCC1 transporter family protein [Thalassovita gelatinovora]QIZ79301.1 GMP synthase [Thalassovita gelatinovora]CUH62532.1 VIT family protein [Thalassovita gelatinovora]SEQ06102.1 Predicted Fe2+/Mn2+ transporter, VIT1/CCC1 family [Thalassovita gelatinovora]